jgi:hypothetical protein
LFERRIVEPVQIGTFSIETRGGEVSALVVRAPQERVRIEVEMPRDLVGARWMAYPPHAHFAIDHRPVLAIFK